MNIVNKFSIKRLSLSLVFLQSMSVLVGCGGADDASSTETDSMILVDGNGPTSTDTDAMAVGDAEGSDSPSTETDILVVGDLDSNGIPDAFETTDASLDLNGNGVIDYYESPSDSAANTIDTNSNGIDDSYEVALSNGADDNSDGIDDAAALASVGSESGSDTGGESTGIEISGLERLTFNDMQGELDGHISNSLFISKDARYLLFSTEATNVISDTTEADTHHDVFLRDTVSGSVTKISASIDGQPGNNASTPSAVSDDGRYSVFSSYSTNVHLNANGNRQVYLYDALSQSTKMISVGSDGEAGRDSSNFASYITGDGSTVFFTTQAANVLGDGRAHFGDIVVHDVASGRTEILDMQGFPYSSYFLIDDVSPDGRFLTLTNTSAEPDTNPMYLHDKVRSTTIFIDYFSGQKLYVSDNGRYISYPTEDDQLVWRDMDTNNRLEIELNTLLPAYVNSNFNRRMSVEAISSDGTQVLYSSYVFDGDSPATSDTLFADVYLISIADQQITLVSQGLNQALSDGRSLGAAFINDDKFIVFFSEAGNLVVDDTNFRSDAFIVPNPLR